VADNFISEEIEKEIVEILGHNHSIVNFVLRGNRISKACLRKVKLISNRNRKKEEDKEPNKLKTQIYTLEYEKTKILKMKNHLQELEQNIENLGIEKESLIQEQQSLVKTEENKREGIKSNIQEY
jgi:predicted RNase H-like nuclease (RuvC/YqgF family)